MCCGCGDYGWVLPKRTHGQVQLEYCTRSRSNIPFSGSFGCCSCRIYSLLPMNSVHALILPVVVTCNRHYLCIGTRIIIPFWMTFATPLTDGRLNTLEHSLGVTIVMSRSRRQYVRTQQWYTEWLLWVDGWCSNNTTKSSFVPLDRQFLFNWGHRNEWGKSISAYTWMDIVVQVNRFSSLCMVSPSSKQQRNSTAPLTNIS